MKNEVKKEQLKWISNSFKSYLNNYNGLYKDIEYPERLPLPSEISKIEAENMFSKKSQAFYQKKYSKAITKFKNIKKDIGKIIFSYQMAFFNEGNAKSVLKGFTKSEELAIFQEVLNNH